MPIHEYACDSCGHVFEELIRRKTDEQDLRCKACGGPNVGRLMSAATVGGSCVSTGSGGG